LSEKKVKKLAGKRNPNGDFVYMQHKNKRMPRWGEKQVM